MYSAVVYSSETGFTEQYAKWISDRLGCACLPAKGLTAERLKKYALVVYGGWVQGGIIHGWSEIRPLIRGKAVVFAVGALPAVVEVTDGLREKNELGSVPFYYFEGGMDYRKIRPGDKRALELYRNSLAKGNPDRLNGQQLFFLNNIGRTFSHLDLESAAGLVADVREEMQYRPESGSTDSQGSRNDPNQFKIR